MHPNTSRLMIGLALVAMFLFGLNIGRFIPRATPNFIQPSPVPTLNTSTENRSYTINDCGVSFTYQSNQTLTEASMAATLATEGISNKIAVACAPEIPRPPLPPEKTEDVEVAGIKTKLYHDASAKDGTPIDAIVIDHPKNPKLDVGFFGYGEEFKKLLMTVQFIN